MRRTELRRTRSRAIRATATTLTVALTLAAAGCGGGSAANDDELVIGTLMPMSGPQKALSNSYLSMKSYFDQVNADGGIDGVKVKLVVEDDQFNAVNTPAAVRKLVDNQKVQMLCANQGSGTFKAISPYLRTKGIGSIPMTGESSLFGADSTGFQLLSPYELTGAHLARHAVEKLGLSKIAIAYTEDGVGLPFRSGAREELEALGLEPVAEVKLNAAATDQTPTAAKLSQSGAEVVLLNHVAPVVSQVVRASDRVGFTPQWGLTYATLNRQVLDLSGDALDGQSFFATPFLDSRADELADYRSAMKKENPDVDETDFLSVEGWVAGSVCTDVIRRAVKAADGVPTAKQLLTALKSTSVDDDLVKGLSWSDTSRTGQRDLQVVAVKDGDFVSVDGFREAPEVSLGDE